MDKQFRNSAIKSSIAAHMVVGGAVLAGSAIATGGLSLLVIPLLAIGSVISGAVTGWFAGLGDSFLNRNKDPSERGGFVGRMVKSFALVAGICAVATLGIAALAGASLGGPLIPLVLGGALLGSAVQGAITGIIGKIFHFSPKPEATPPLPPEQQVSLGRENQRRNGTPGDNSPPLSPGVTPSQGVDRQMATSRS